MLSLGPIWTWAERAWTRPAKDIETSGFPVLVRNQATGYKAEPAGRIPADSFIVSEDFDEEAINKDLNAIVGSNRRQKFFQVLERTPEVTRVTLEVPTRHFGKLQSWYEIRKENIVPQELLTYGAGFAFAILPLAAVCGVVAAMILAIFVKPRKQGSL